MARLSEILSDYHAEVIDYFKRASVFPNERRRKVAYAAEEIRGVLNNKFQTLLLRVIEWERGGESELEVRAHRLATLVDAMQISPEVQQAVNDVLSLTHYRKPRFRS